MRNEPYSVKSIVETVGIESINKVADVKQLYVTAIASELIFNDCPIIYV